MRKNKNSKSRVILGEAVFWLHTVILIAITVSGLFMAWWLVVIVLLVVKAQQMVFHGCILTILQAKEGQIKKGMAYYQLAARRFFGVRLGRRGVSAVAVSHNILTLGVLVWANIYGVRVHL